MPRYVTVEVMFSPLHKEMHEKFEKDNEKALEAYGRKFPKENVRERNSTFFNIQEFETERPEKKEK